MLYKDNIFDLVDLLRSVFSFFVTTNHVNHWTSLDPASSRGQSKFKMEDVSVKADKNFLKVIECSQVWAKSRACSLH